MPLNRQYPFLQSNNPSSFPVIFETIASRSLRGAMLVGMAMAASTFVVEHPACAQPTQPNVTRESRSAVDPVTPLITEASQRFGIPAYWIRAVMEVESGGDAHALSPKGATGLMQIMPTTWEALRTRYDLGANPYDPHDNILAGAAYLRELFDRYGAAGFLAAYNAGPARYEDNLATGRPLPDETRAYIAMLAPMIAGGQVDGAVIVASAVRSWAEAPLFAVRAESGSTGSQMTSDRHYEQPSTDTQMKSWAALAPQSGGLFVAIGSLKPQP